MKVLEGYKEFRDEIESRAQEDVPLRALIDEISQSYNNATSRPTATNIITFSTLETGEGLMAVFAVYFLFRFGKDWLDNKRAMNETAVLERRVALVQQMIKDGWTQKTAEIMVNGGLEVIAKRTHDDPAYNTFLQAADSVLRPNQHNKSLQSASKEGERAIEEKR